MDDIPMFLGEDPDRALAKSRALADDFARLVAGETPTAADLADAPLLDNWAFVMVGQTTLVGSVSGHPRMGDRPFMRTSALFAIDPHQCWARTWSRFYRLGRGALVDTGGDQ